MKIGILGGTFNPIHNGHIEFASKFAKVLALDKIIVIPAAVPPHKKSGGIAPFSCRYDMCLLATGELPLFEVSGIEERREGKSYTIDTVNEIKKAYPDAELYLIIGSDMLLIFKEWYKYTEILKSCTICTVLRKSDETEDGNKLNDFLEYKKSLEALNGKIFVGDFSVLNVSSTQIRTMAKKGQIKGGLLNENVEAYIKEHKLYNE